MASPVEITTRYATVVDDLTAAWAFVMSRVDAVGPDPSIHISPFWGGTAHEELLDVEDVSRRFEVVVEGTVPEDG